MTDNFDNLFDQLFENIIFHPKLLLKFQNIKQKHESK
jgi:hypothetical protein